MLTPAIIDAVIAQVGTDAPRATVLGMLNEAYMTQVADSRWVRTVSPVYGGTVAGQSQYVMPTNIVELYGLRVGSAVHESIGIDSLWNARSGRGSIRGNVYAQTYNATGGAVVDIHPVPETSGVPIMAFGAILPALLTDVSTSAPVTPDDTHSSLIDGTAALVLMRIDERPDLAQGHQARFEQRTEDLRRRKNNLLQGSGPLRLQVQGYDF